MTYEKEISVIIPTYKKNLYLYDCLESINNQTIDKSKIEVLIVHNGVNLDYGTELQTMISKYSLDIKYFYIPVPSVSTARNFGISASSGRFILFLDDDDVLSKNYLLSLFELSDDVNIIASNMKSFKGEITTCEDDYISKKFNSYQKKILSPLECLRYSNTVCNKLFPSKMLKEKLFCDELELSEDTLFMLEILTVSTRFIFSSSDVIYFRRVNSASSSRKRRGALSLLTQYLKFIYLSQRLLFEKDSIKVLILLKCISRTKGLFYQFRNNLL